MKRKTKEEFIKESISIHRDKYNYKKIEYLGNKIKVKIICYSHGEFEQMPQHHLSGSGCPSCSNNLPLTTKSFIKKSKKIHKYYDYSLVEYNGSHTKVSIVCPLHGEFEQEPANHLNGQGCKKCNTANIKGDYIDFFIRKCSKKFRRKYDYSALKNEFGKIILSCKKHGEFKIDPNLHIKGKHCNGCELDKRKGKLNSRKKMFFKKCNIIHNGKYSYNESTFKNQNSIIEIICPNHGEFTQKANSHILGSGCIKCSGVELKSTDLFIIQASKNHNNYYDYSKVEYKGSHSYIEIICPNHGQFTQKAYSHLNMLQGCPKCKSSKGEKIARMYFEKNNINYIEQYTFDGCYYKDKLRFDFYLPDMDICVEYDGVQHFESVRKFGGKKKFELQKIKDEIKNKYCFNNNIKMIRIPYYENVFEFLDKEFNLKTKKIKEFFTPFQRTIFHITEFMENKSEYKFSDMIREIDHHYKSDGNANSSLRKFFKKIPKYRLEKRNNNTYILNI